MVSAKLLQITASFVLCHMFCKVTPQHCDEGQYSIFGKMLRGHIFKKMKVSMPRECLEACNEDFRCLSFNYVFMKDVCELNNRTKEARPEDFVPDSNRYYFRRNTKTVLLGSIREFPAKSCKEIKLSEGGQAASGKYWFDSVIPGKTISINCNMETEDADECNASIPLCDIVNGICNNTLGSYLCSCKVGFTGDGKTCTDIDECSASPSVCDVNANCQNNEGSYICSCNAGFTGDGITCTAVQSCAALRANSVTADGIYQLELSSTSFSVYCDMRTEGQGWTLVARFSNNDVANWMADTGEWWYNKTVAVGETTEPSNNTDMISPAFWLVHGTEFKITRSDDSQHTALLQTTGNCLTGQAFRSKITSYGNFRNGIVWASDQCRGNCTVQYSGQYQTTQGFQQASCSGDLQSANFIGFWCDWSGGDGSVMMIGGGGTSCARADHGIGITENNEASFVFSSESDFGDESSLGTNSYSLNLWIR